MIVKSGDVVIVKIQFTDTLEIKKRPVLVLFEEYNNLVVAGITSNTSMKGIPLLKKNGVLKDSVIKLNYIFTISNNLVYKKLFSLNKIKRKEVYSSLTNKLKYLI